MLEGERDVLREMGRGSITPAVARLHMKVREPLLLVGHSYNMPKEILAIIHVLGSAAAGYVPPEKTEVAELANELNDAKDPTPLDEINLEEQALIEEDNKQLNGDATGGKYTGNRIKWETDFKSTPGTPIAKLEKGRPISFIDPKNNQRYFGRFVKVSPKDKRMANVLANGKKVPCAVPMKNVEVTDLSPPSTEPLSVQI